MNTLRAIKAPLSRGLYGLPSARSYLQRVNWRLADQAGPQMQPFHHAQCSRKRRKREKSIEWEDENDKWRIETFVHKNDLNYSLYKLQCFYDCKIRHDEHFDIFVFEIHDDNIRLERHHCDWSKSMIFSVALPVEALLKNSTNWTMCSCGRYLIMIAFRTADTSQSATLVVLIVHGLMKYPAYLVQLFYLRFIFKATTNCHSWGMRSGRRKPWAPGPTCRPQQR